MRTSQQILKAASDDGLDMPTRPWLGRQAWRNMAMLHWRMDAADLQARMPANLTLDTHDGSAWVTLVAYRMAHVRVRCMPEALSLNFVQLNLRTYVQHRGRRGIYFFSLDTGAWLPKALGQIVTGLPYHRAAMALRHEGAPGGGVEYGSVRPDGAAQVNLRYNTDGVAIPVGPTEAWLLNRWAFFRPGSGDKMVTGEVRHGAWPLQEIAVTLERNTLGDAAGIPLHAKPDLAHYSPGVDVLFWRPR